MAPQKIKSLREQAQVRLAVFAAVLNTSLSTVQQWEVGDKTPSGPSLKLLNLIERKGLEAIICSVLTPGLEALREITNPRKGARNPA